MDTLRQRDRFRGILLRLLKNLGLLRRIIPRRHAGLFVTHRTSARIEQHFARIRREGSSCIDWSMLLDRDGEATAGGLNAVALEECMPDRYLQMQKTGRLIGGFMDTLIIPFVIATRAPYVWIMEYDVDFSASWQLFFSEFQHNTADLLTTTLFPRNSSESWCHWREAAAPPEVDDDAYYRDFHPIMRLSRRFALKYAKTLSTPGWAGHYEFTIPTVAMSCGFSVEDIGGSGPLCPPDRRGKFYSNTSEDETLSPGSFVWRPSRTAFFHERPEQFPVRRFLYHPVKPDMEDWERTHPVGLAAAERP